MATAWMPPPARVQNHPAHEMAVLGGLLDLLAVSNADEARKAATGLSGEMFTVDGGPEIFSAVQAALDTDHPNVGDVFVTAQQQYPGAAAVVRELLGQQYVGLGYSTTKYAAETKQAHARRLADAALADAIAAANAPDATADDITSVIEQLGGVRDAMLQRADAAGGSGCRDILTVVDSWARNEREAVIPTQLRVLDNAFGGGLPVGLVGIGAKPGEGKSALAGQLMLGALEQDKNLRAVWFRGEMSNDLLVSKLITTWANFRPGLESYTFREARRRDRAARAAAADMAATIGDRLAIVDPPLTPDRMERHVADIRPGLVVVDYLQLCQAEGQQDRRAEIEHVTRRLAQMANKFAASIIVVSAIAKATSITSGIGTLAKDSNLLDYDVHSFLTLWREPDNKDPPHPSVLKIEKSRTAAATSLELLFDGARQCFKPAAAAEFDAFADFSVEGVA